jgi:hypothetical protein
MSIVWKLPALVVQSRHIKLRVAGGAGLDSNFNAASLTAPGYSQQCVENSNLVVPVEGPYGRISGGNGDRKKIAR